MASAAAPANAPRAAATAAPSDIAAMPVDPFRRRVLMSLVILCTVMQVLDQTIANVALPHMQGALGASPDTVTWVLTSYIVAAAVATPVTGWLQDRFGRRALLITTVAGFTFASTMCAMSISLPMMVGARLMQGIFGAFIVPAGQSLILDINPRSRHPQAMMIWALAAMVAPVLGPVLGGWLTDAFGWRWVFLINLPIGLVGLAGLLLFMPRIGGRPSRFDATGFLLLLVAIASFQLMIDRGAQNDWFDSLETMIEAGLAISAGWAFVVHVATAPEPLMPRAIFRDRNLVVATVFILLMVGLVIASSALTPPLLQRLYGYDAYGAGMLTAPRGIGMAISMILGTRLANLVDRRLVILIGLALVATSIRMMMHFSLEMDGVPVAWSGLVQGLGFGLVFLPLNLMAFGTLDPRYRTQGAGLYNLARSLSGSIAISLATVIITRQEQVSHADLAGHVTAQRLPLPAFGFTQQFGMTSDRVFGLVDAEINRQATMIAYIDAFSLMFWMVILASPLVLLLKAPRAVPAGAEEAALAVE